VNKLAALEAVPESVADGAAVALGGAWLSNHPMSAVRELVRAGTKDLHLIETTGSIDVDLLIGAGAVGHLTFSMVSLEAFGLAPQFRRAVEDGSLGITEMSGVALNHGLEAAARRLPYLPMRGLGGSEFPARHPDRYASIECPFTGEPLLGIRAIEPDVTIIHVLRADIAGNCQYEGPVGLDPELAMAADRVIVTCEEIVSRDAIAAAADATRVPGYLVDTVIEAPFGAHPTTHVPRYGLDAPALLEYAETNREGADSWAAYLARLREESEEEYRARALSGDRAAVLGKLTEMGAQLSGSLR
jgi:glutaconate CoA-transferase subunit A